MIVLIDSMARDSEGVCADGEYTRPIVGRVAPVRMKRGGGGRKGR